VTFSVNTRALAGLPVFFDRRGTDLTDAIEFVTKNTVLSSFGLANVLGAHQKIILEVTDYLGGLTFDYSDRDAARVRSAIASYNASDERASQRADAAITGLPPNLPNLPALTAAERSYGPAIFDDRRAPTSALITPGDPHADYPYRPSWSDALSPTSIARDAIWRVTSVLANAGLIDRPIDPLESLVKPFVGDWAGLLRSADVFDCLGSMLTMSGECVSDAGQLVPTVWTGNVADMCINNLQSFDGSLARGVTPLARLAATYRRVSAGVRDNANLLETVITNLIDLAADLVLDLATDFIFELFEFGTQTRDFIRTLRAAMRLANSAIDVVNAWLSGVGDFKNQFGFLNSVGGLPSILFPIPAIPLVPSGAPSGPAPPVPSNSQARKHN
jgi:hypothetical protein